VGRRIDRNGVSLDEARQLLRTAAALRPADVLVPKGIYRFSTFEEADRWMRETVAALAAIRHQ